MHWFKLALLDDLNRLREDFCREPLAYIVGYSILFLIAAVPVTICGMDFGPDYFESVAVVALYSLCFLFVGGLALCPARALELYLEHHRRTSDKLQRAERLIRLLDAPVRNYSIPPSLFRDCLAADVAEAAAKLLAERLPTVPPSEVEAAILEAVYNAIFSYFYAPGQQLREEERLAEGKDSPDKEETASGEAGVP